MPALSPVVTIDDLAAYAAGSSSIVEAAAEQAPDANPKVNNLREFTAVTAALASAESFGARWLGYDADGFHVHLRTDTVFVLDPLVALADPYAYAPVRPVVQVASPADGAPVPAGWGITLPTATPGEYVSAVTYCGYAPTGVSTADLRQLDGLDGLAVNAVVPELPGPLMSAVCESALAILTRIDSGSIGKTESEFQVSTMTRKTVRLAKEPLREIWELYAQAYRILS